MKIGNINFYNDFQNPQTSIEHYIPADNIKNMTLKEIILNIVEDSISNPVIGCIDIYTPPMYDGLYLGSYMKGDFVDNCPPEMTKSYLNYKISTISALKKGNHIDYYIYLREE